MLPVRFALDWVPTPLLIHYHSSLESNEMLQDLVSMIVMMLPVFVLLILTFGAGFVVGRLSKREQ